MQKMAGKKNKLSLDESLPDLEWEILKALYGERE